MDRTKTVERYHRFQRGQQYEADGRYRAAALEYEAAGAPRSAAMMRRAACLSVLARLSPLAPAPPAI